MNQPAVTQPSSPLSAVPSREQLLHLLYEAAELEHNLMCTYLYAAFSLRDRDDPSLSPREADAVTRWRATIMRIATEEMGHLAAVWNITSALGGAPSFGRDNFPLDPGSLPAGVVVKLAPFNAAVLQHFIYLERPHGSAEPDGEGFAPEYEFHRGSSLGRLTPMAMDYDTVGEFYGTLSAGVSAFVEKHGESAAFCGDPGLQLSAAETRLLGIKPVICGKTAIAAFDAIVKQGEGASADEEYSHYRAFVELRAELRELCAANPKFQPAYPAAVNPVLRRPLRATGRVWIEDELAAALVDGANSSYMLMLRLLAYAYMVPRPAAEKGLVIDIAVGLMRAATQLAEAAVRRPAGPSNPECHAGMSFTALRDSGAFPRGEGARRFFLERLQELSAAVNKLAGQGERERTAAALLAALEKRAQRGFEGAAREAAAVQLAAAGGMQSSAANALAASRSGAANASSNGSQLAAANAADASRSAAAGSQPAANGVQLGNGKGGQLSTAALGGGALLGDGVAALQTAAAAQLALAQAAADAAAALQAVAAGLPLTAASGASAHAAQAQPNAREGAAALQAAAQFDPPLSAAAASASTQPQAAKTNGNAAPASPPTQVIDGVEHVEGSKLQLLFEGKRCIHARFCVTGAPKVFLANVQGPWIHPDAMPVERLVDIAHACPSGAIRYRRKDAQPDESAPPVNLASVRENGPYAFRADILLEGEPLGYRATLCRCGASKNKPFCDGSHHDAPFVASGEPSTGSVEMLPTRDGPLEIEPEINGPLEVRGNLEILSGTGRAVARVTSARLCRCGGSANKPFCDNTHARIGFKSV